MEQRNGTTLMVGQVWKIRDKIYELLEVKRTSYDDESYVQLRHNESGYIWTHFLCYSAEESWELVT